MAEQQEIKRQIAFKTSIEQLLKGQFVKKTGWESSFVMTEYGDFSRINIIAAVVAKQDNGQGITVDDGTGQISGRFFEETNQLQSINVGDIILVIAKPREYNEQLYLTLEIVKKIQQPGWIKYRKKELTLIKKIRTINQETSAAPSKPKDAPIVESTSTLSSKERILQTIQQLDTGSGASIDDVIMTVKTANTELMIQDMIMKGELFEVRPGRLKIL